MVSVKFSLLLVNKKRLNIFVIGGYEASKRIYMYYSTILVISSVYVISFVEKL